MKVLVGSGEEFPCSKVCQGVQIVIQGHHFVLDLFVLNMGGSDIVLGAQWLKQLGPVLMDYQKLTMKFIHHNKLVELKGTMENDKISLSLTQLQQLVQTGGATQLYSLQVKPLELAQPHVQLEHDDERIQILLREFSPFH